MGEGTRARVPADRIASANDAPVRPEGDFVVYWMIAARRTHASFGLQRAVEWSRELGRPLIVLEALRVGYPWASDRLHTFVLQGMADDRARLAEAGVAHHVYVEPTPGAGKGLLAALARRAAVVVTDRFPAFFLPRMVAAAGRQLEVRLETVDGNGLMPLAVTPKAFARAVDLRRFLQKHLRPHLHAFPVADPLAGADHAAGAEIPDEVARGWPAADDARLAGRVDDLPIDHAVPPVGSLRGGPEAGRAVLERFVSEGLDRYADDQRHPDADGSSGLSPWLHWGHVGAHQVAAAVLEREGWSPDDLGDDARGAKEGWWGVSPSAEAFLDELVTWRELGYVFCHHRSDADRYEATPEWAQRTLAEHAGDPRPARYSLEQLERAETHDEVWNAAQRQLLREGRIHNYLRMLWGKNVLAWSASPDEAFRRLVHLNDRWALDGRDPNSYSGIGWVFGRFDRAWGPERPIFGKVRYMTSDNTLKKLRMRDYMERYGGPG